MADGKGCICWANSYSECGCDADWTPQEVYNLKAALARKDAEIAEYREAMNYALWQHQGGGEPEHNHWSGKMREVLNKYPKE